MQPTNIKNDLEPIPVRWPRKSAHKSLLTLCVMEKTSVNRRVRKYDKNFKDEAVRMVQNGRSVPEVAKTLGIGENLLYRWRTEHQTTLSVSDVISQTEIDQLRKQLRSVETERDILKKALLIFGRQT